MNNFIITEMVKRQDVDVFRGLRKAVQKSKSAKNYIENARDLGKADKEPILSSFVHMHTRMGSKMERFDWSRGSKMLVLVEGVNKFRTPESPDLLVQMEGANNPRLA